jgi:hypothetical protein
MTAKQAALQQGWDEADPALKAEFEKEYEREDKLERFAFFVASQKQEQRYKALVAMSVPGREKGALGSDADWLASLSAETRARLLLDGRSLP